MAEHNIIGQKGEDIAAKMMQKKGFRIKERNWKWGHLEIDIIAENRKEIVFVEVKTRTSEYGGIRPEAYVQAEKKRNMVSAANAYIRHQQIEKTPRFDIVGILLDKDTFAIKEQKHLEDAFTPSCKTIGRMSFSKLWKWGAIRNSRD